MEVFDFPSDIQERDYRVFPDTLEKDAEVLFHGTSRDAFEAISREGFSPSKVLKSVSFARDSALALSYACQDEGNGVILVVRFCSQSGVRQESSIVYLDDLKNQPEIIGYCIVPYTYRHV
jgi:RNA:NAD 2'-phosphotransferase (TPT1/KptA family)